MKVSKLIKKLQELPPDKEVFISEGDDICCSRAVSIQEQTIYNNHHDSEEKEVEAILIQGRR
jgi:hypothetical protein